MTSRSMSFADLQEFLEHLGFEQCPTEKGTLFRHPASETLLTFRRYEPHEAVRAADIAVARKMLDERGILPAERFEKSSNKTPA